MASVDKFVGYLISIECRNLFYQGVVSSIDSANGSIQLRNCFQNGLHCGNKLIDIKTVDIENVEILADPQSAPSILKPKAPPTPASNDKSISNNSFPISSLSDRNDSAGNSAKSSSSSSSSSNSSSSSDTVDDGPYSSTTSNRRAVKTNKKSLRALDFNSKITNNSNGVSGNSVYQSNTSQYSSNQLSRPAMNGGFKRSKSNGTNLSPPLGKSSNSSNRSALIMSSSSKQQQQRKSKRELNGGGHKSTTTTNQQQENCFNSLPSEIVRDEFDFETNLALFDKNAFYEQVEGHSKPVNSTNLSSPHESLNAYDLVIKQLNQTNLANNQNQPQRQQQQQQIYRPITIENLFSSGVRQPVQVDTKALSDSEAKTSSSSASSRSSASSTSSSSSSSTKNYRFDEMVLDTGEPIQMQQIQVPCRDQVPQTYVTDDGFIVPCIDGRLRKLLFDAAYRYGFSKQRQIESMGRCCTEMALQLVGGPLRFSPKNSHQKPSILIVAAKNQVQGACALYTARLLSTRNIKVYLLTIDSREDGDIDFDAEVAKCFQTELELVTSSDSKSVKLVQRVNELAKLNVAFDLIISGGSLSQSSMSSQQAAELVKSIEMCKASVLAIDPSETAAATAATLTLPSKWCILPVLPLAMPRSCGRVYLCDLGFTKQIFDSVDIRYDQSPFGAKFLIPLHND